MDMQHGAAPSEQHADAGAAKANGLPAAPPQEELTDTIKAVGHLPSTAAADAAAADAAALQVVSKAAA